MALADYFEPLTRVTAETSPDGLGGTRTVYTDGDVIRAGIARKGATEALIASQKGLATYVNVITAPAVKLSQGDLLRRSDGTLYRVTSNGKDFETPPTARTQLAIVSAEVITP